MQRQIEKKLLPFRTNFGNLSPKNSKGFKEFKRVYQSKLFLNQEIYIKECKVNGLIAISSTGAGVPPSRAGATRALLSELSLALGLVSLPGHLLHHVGALLLGHRDTLPVCGAGTLLLVNILGHRGRLVLAHFLSFVATYLARSVDVIANLEVNNQNQIYRELTKLPVW